MWYTRYGRMSQPDHLSSCARASELWELILTFKAIVTKIVGRKLAFDLMYSNGMIDRLKVVIVTEDEFLVPLDIAEILRQEGFEIIEADNGTKTLRF
jgi:hypothetical protein